jgi:LysM repeat protein
MQRTKRYLARLLALLAIAAAVVAVVVIASAFKNESNEDKKGGRGRTTTHAKEAQPKHRTKAKTYTVQSGDTLTSIAHKTGVPVAEILALNPEVDPQILIAGQTLKLK